MQPVSAANTAQMVNQTRATGQRLQSQYDKQAQQAYGQYQGTVGQTNQAYQNLLGYTKGMQSGQQMYSQDLGKAQQAYGYRPGTTQQAAQGLTTAENIMAALPKATQEMGAYSGATAGQVAQNYSNMAQNIGQQVTNANNALKNQMGLIAAAQNQANQESTLGVQTQAQELQGYQNLYSSSISQMQQAATTMNNLQQLQQNQGFATAQQVAQYQNAYSKYIDSAANAAQANSQAALNKQKYQQYQHMYGLMQGVLGGSASPQQISSAEALIKELTGHSVNLGNLVQNATNNATLPVTQAVGGVPLQVGGGSLLGSLQSTGGSLQG